MAIIGDFGAIDDQIIRIRMFVKKVGLLRPLRLERPLRSMRLQRFIRSGKSLLKDLRVILVLEFNNLRTKFFFDRIMKTLVEFLTPLCWRLFRLVYVTFLKID